MEFVDGEDARDGEEVVLDVVDGEADWEGLEEDVGC